MYILVLTLNIKITKHAKEQMINRVVEKEEIKKAIQRGAKIKQTDGFLSHYGYILVAWKKVGEDYIIKTVMIKG